MSHLELKDVVCVDEEGGGLGKRPAILVDAEYLITELWFLRDQVHATSEVQHKGDSGTLVLEHHTILPLEARRARIDRVLDERARKLHEEQARAAGMLRAAEEARQKAEDARRARARVRRPADRAPLVDQEPDDPAVKRFKLLELDDDSDRPHDEVGNPPAAGAEAVPTPAAGALDEEDDGPTEADRRALEAAGIVTVDDLEGLRAGRERLPAIHRVLMDLGLNPDRSPMEILMRIAAVNKDPSK